MCAFGIVNPRVFCSVCICCTSALCHLIQICVAHMWDDLDVNSGLCFRYSPSLLGMKVLESRNVNRAKLYYLRDRKPSEYRS